jgi:hypothetical protein
MAPDGRKESDGCLDIADVLFGRMEGAEWAEGVSEVRGRVRGVG